MFKKEIQGLKYDNKRMNMDLKDSKERFEKVKMDYQQQFGTLKNTTVAMKQQLQKEYEGRTTSENRFMVAQKQLKISRQENTDLESQVQKSTKGTMLVISMQNFVRKMLQEKLEDSASQIESLSKQNEATMSEI